mgnify:CR=1 FL=1
MSQNKSRTYINIASFKLNRISLFNQSGFNPFLHKEKKTKNYINLFKQENNIQKINPLTKKNKIIKRHNILKKIDFYINDNKTYNEKNNNNSSKDLSLINSKPPLQRNNIHLPFLVYNNNYRLLQNAKRNRNNYSQPINLYKNYNLKNSYSYISNSVFSQNNLFNSNYQQNESNKNRVIKSPKIVSFKSALYGNPIGNLTGMYDTQKVGKVFYEDAGHEDYILWLTILKKGFFAKNTNTVEARYRVAEKSVSSNKGRAASWTWNIYRKTLKFNVIKSAFCYSIYMVKGVLKYLK